MNIKRWKREKVVELFELPFLEQIFQALSTHRQNFEVTYMEYCSLLSIKTGGCPEDCAYCSQSAHYKTDVEKKSLITVDEVKNHAKEVKQNGAKKLCIGAAWSRPHKKDLPIAIEMIKAIKEEGLEACATLGMLAAEQAVELKNAGLDYYSHNLDTSLDYYKNIITTRTYQDRIDTLQHVHNAGINTCCGGIFGMGETRDDRVDFLTQLANLPGVPESVPINRLIQVKGTPLGDSEPLDDIEFVRTIAAARIMMPKSVIRLSAGRGNLSEPTQTLCFLAGANSIWLGDKLLTAKNSDYDKDIAMLVKLGFKTASVC